MKREEKERENSEAGNEVKYRGANINDVSKRKAGKRNAVNENPAFPNSSS